MPEDTSVPLQYAYKEEGQDVDDGLQGYESQEEELAKETLRVLQRNLREEDFQYLTNSDEVPLPNNVQNRNPSSEIEAALASPLNAAKILSSETSKLDAKQLPDEMLALSREIHKQLEFLVVPTTKKEIEDTVIRLKFCMYALFLLNLCVEDEDYESHPVLHNVHELLQRVRDISVPSSIIEKENKALLRKKRKLKEEKSSLDSGPELAATNKGSSEVAPRTSAPQEIVKNRGLTRARPKDRKNPRVNQRRKYRRGLRKVRSVSKSFRPQSADRFDGVRNIRSHILRSRALS